MKLILIIRLVSVCLLLVSCSIASWLVGSSSDLCSSNRESQPRRFGQPNSQHVIIFVHGFCGDTEESWINDETQFDFPKELAKDLDDFYIVSFDYVSRLQRSPSILSVADHLELEINELLKGHPYRTIRFVSHSMGGIMVREYVLRHYARSHPKIKITNLVLLATPTNGSGLAELR